MLAVPDHPRFAGFGAAYADKIAPWLATFEEKRKKTLRLSATIAAGAVGVTVLLLLFAFFVIDPHPVVAVVAFGGVPAFAGAFATYLPIWLFKTRIKIGLLPKVTEVLGLTYRLKPADFPFDRFQSAGLLPRHDRKHLEDSVSGSHEGAEFELCEAVLSKRKSSSNSSGESHVTVFRGLLFVFDFHKRFSGTTIVTRDPGALGKLFPGGKPDRVALEDPHFEKIFEAYGTDQVEARYLLTPAFMERVVALAELTTESKRPPELAFIGDKLVIAARTKKNKFESGSIFTRMDDPKRTEGLLREFEQVLRIIETVKPALNTVI